MKTPTPVKKPDKEKFKKWYRDHREKKEAPPTPEQIRRELGWELDKDYDKNRK